MDKLRVRVYNVRFGDAILVSVPDQDANGNTETRHILIDVGNAKKPRIEDGGGHEDTVFEPVVKNIVQTLAGRPLDLYVMTHEHWDHVQGLPYVDRIGIFPNEKLKDKLQVRHAWFTASADPDYYDSHPDAQKALDETKAVYETIERFLQAAPEQENPFIQALMLNNNPNATAYYVDRLRELAPNDRPWYVHRPLPDHPEDSLDGKHPFQQARFKIWAPEEDTSVYYRKLQPMALGVAGTGASGAEPTLTRPTPPPGVDAGAFYDLVETRRRGFLDNLLAIDKAKNNTSIVFLLEWRGWKLLFAGDAEKKSWQMMDKHSQLEEVHFLKVSHHGSHTGMPPDNLLDRILPGDSRVSSDGKPRYAVVSTYPKTYSNVPHQKTIGELKKRCTLYSTEKDLEDGGYMYIDFEFEGGGKGVTVRKG